MLVSGCGPKPEGAMLGGWERQGKREQIQFKADGTIEGADAYGRHVQGSYELLSGNRLRMTLSVRSTNENGTIGVDNSTGVCTVQVSGDQLVLVEPGGTEQIYRRVP